MGYEPSWSLDAVTGSLDLSTDRLVSRGRPVTATRSSAAYPPGAANDGNAFNLNISGDSTNYYLPPGVPYTWTVDLERAYDLSRVDIAFRTYNGSEAYSGYTVEASDDGQSWTSLVAATANRTVGFTSDALTGNHRYVRLSVSKVVNDHNGNAAAWAAGLVEVQVYAHRDPQSIDFGALPDTTYGAADLPLHATASSGLPVRFAAAGACGVQDGTLHLLGAGRCTVTASQPGDADFDPAGEVSHTFDIVYGIHILTDLGRPVPRHGGTLRLALQLTNASGHNVSSRSVPVRALGIDLPATATAGDGARQRGQDQGQDHSRGHDAGQAFVLTGRTYHHAVPARGLSPGTHVLSFVAGDDPTTRTVTFTVRSH